MIGKTQLKLSKTKYQAFSIKVVVVVIISDDQIKKKMRFWILITKDA